MLPVTGLYAGLFALGFVFLASRVIKARRVYRVAIGTGQHPRTRPRRHRPREACAGASPPNVRC